MTVVGGGYLPSDGGIYTGPDLVNDVDAISRVLQNTLDAVVQTFNEAQRELPARRYIHSGGTAVDCAQLTVQLDQAYIGTPGADPNQLQQCQGPRTCGMTVQLWRPAPSLGPRAQAPTVDQLSNAALDSARDTWLLLAATSLIDTRAGWGTGVIAEVTALEPQGMFTGLAMSVVVPVP